MKILKRVLPIVLAVCLLASLGAVSAIDAGETRTVIGADLTDDQIKTVYKTFGIERGSVKELTVTNQDERQYLSGVISDAQIGTKSISCISIEVLAAGKGMTVNTSHITYCTSQMYISALATAGIMDAKISVAAPFDVSGTAALTGIYKAYEDITGTKLDETAKAVSSQELATTAELAQAIGDYDSVEIVNELKLILNETKDMTDAELRSSSLSAPRRKSPPSPARSRTSSPPSVISLTASSRSSASKSGYRNPRPQAAPAGGVFAYQSAGGASAPPAAINAFRIFQPAAFSGAFRVPFCAWLSISASRAPASPSHVCRLLHATETWVCTVPEDIR